MSATGILPAVLKWVCLERLGSTRWTPFALASLALAAWFARPLGVDHAWLVAGPLLLLSVNLLVALVRYRRFRRDRPLLLLHLALLVMVLVLAVGQLVGMEGRVRLVDGTAFDGALHTMRAGPLYPGGATDIRYTHLGFERLYREGGEPNGSGLRLRWLANDGALVEALVRPDQPLVLDDHQVYPMRSRGHVARLRWMPDQGPGLDVELPMPDWTGDVEGQSLTWQPPGVDRPLWFGLDFAEAPLDPRYAGREPGEAGELVRLVVRDGASRILLAPGVPVRMGTAGRIELLEMGAWHGFRIIYDPAGPWLLAAGLLATLGLGWYYVRGMRAVRWARPA